MWILWFQDHATEMNTAVQTETRQERFNCLHDIMQITETITHVTGPETDLKKQLRNGLIEQRRATSTFRQRIRGFC